MASGRTHICSIWNLLFMMEPHSDIMQENTYSGDKSTFGVVLFYHRLANSKQKTTIRRYGRDLHENGSNIISMQLSQREKIKERFMSGKALNKHDSTGTKIKINPTAQLSGFLILRRCKKHSSHAEYCRLAGMRTVRGRGRAISSACDTIQWKTPEEGGYPRT